MEAHPINNIPIPLENRLFSRFRAHTSGMSIQITHTAVSRKETTRLVMPIPAAIIALDPSLLLPLRRIWKIRVRGKTCRGGWARRWRGRRRGGSRVPRGRPRSGREFAHPHLLLGELLGGEGRTCLEAPLILAAALLAPAPLWRPATAVVSI
jgi:hypothetical protein